MAIFCDDDDGDNDGDDKYDYGDDEYDSDNGDNDYDDDDRQLWTSIRALSRSDDHLRFLVPGSPEATLTRCPLSSS